jgi:hypothetical protein
VVEVLLTPVGVGLAERVTDDIGRALAPLTGALAGRDRRQLQRLLERLVGPPAPSIGPPAS